jgi:hypothetical protein
MKINTPTEASVKRYEYALQLASTCPATLYQEVALTGSSAKGIADEQSDIEINFWGQAIPSAKQRVDWLTENGVTEIVVNKKPRPDSSYWINGIYKGIALEVGWQSEESLFNSLNIILNANTIDHRALRLADIILSAISLQGEGVLEYWQNQLSFDYSDVLQTRLIHDCFAKWGRGKYDDHTLILRAVFALNRVWEVNWKRWIYELPKLTALPPNFQSRLDDGDRVQLILDTLTLIQTIRPDLSGFIESVRATIDRR